MKYKHIPKPILEEGQEARPLHDLKDNIFTIGWEVGHYKEILDPELPDDIEPQKEWVKDYEVMSLTPEQEVNWRNEQEPAKPTQETNALTEMITEMSKATTIAQMRNAAKEFLDKTE